ncbi:hypothetical protein CICLE_v10014121mg [Citrus x clementina]|uniref:MHD1 domain-containing protein n=1 Tax=Citrus clementina TaxID=85681 RepID=V4UAF1_CITCL|nr:hypothetical protein CICLE_v10014121mg [Citrus x clementina]
MFTEGLDESAINWVKQKQDCVDGEPRIRSPLTERLSHDPFPKSPLIFNNNNSNASSLLSPHSLPPLKFHSGLLKSVLTPRLDDAEDCDDNENDSGNEEESVDSVSSNMDVSYSEEEDEEDLFDKASEGMHNDDKGETFGYKSGNYAKLNRGFFNDLKIEVPENNRRFPDGDLGCNNFSKKILTPSSGSSSISSHLRERVQLRNAQRAASNVKTMINEVDDMGTPSAPPITEVGAEEKEQMEKTGNGVCESRVSECLDGTKKVLTDWKSQFQNVSELDERLHKFLLQPRGVKPVELGNSKGAQHVHLVKAKKVMGKIRVEVKKVRVIPRRKLRSTYSLRSAMYIEAGAQYVRRVSSLVKNGMNSLKLASFPLQSEDHLSCLFQLKSATEETDVEKGSTICLLPGSGDYHVFFPECEGDALLVEVQDKKNSVHGRATIPVSSLTDNPSGSVVETLAYDLLLEAAMRAQHFHPRNLRLQGPWKWLLTEFADYYGVSDSYTKLRYLLHVMNVATPTKDCLELVNELLVPILKARSEKSLTRQEKSMLLDCETQIESLLEKVFENYKSLDENSPTGLAELFGPAKESVAPALAPAVQVYCLLHDILSQDAQTMLKNYLQTAAKKRCRNHMLETDEFVSTSSDGFLMDSITMSTAYLKMKNLCISIRNEIQSDIKIHNHHILPSSIDLSNIAAAVYSTELCNRLRGFLAAWPASSPLPHVNELLVAVADFEWDIESWNISPVQGGVDAKGLFDDYIMLWVEDMQLKLLDLCKMEKVPWSGVATSHSTSPFAEEMYEKIKNSLIEYEVVINRWPQYSLVLENAVANVERAIIKAMEKQYNDILAPLKDSIQKRLNLHVQKLTRRQSSTLYSVPSQLGTFLNTIKRILDILHCRVEDILKSWASCLPAVGDKKSLFGEQMNGVTVLLRTKYKNYLQAIVEQLVSNMQANRTTRLKRILEDIKEEDAEADVREKMQMLSSQLIDSISNLHQVFSNRIFIAISRGFWDRMGQVISSLSPRLVSIGVSISRQPANPTSCNRS